MALDPLLILLAILLPAGSLFVGYRILRLVLCRLEVRSPDWLPFLAIASLPLALDLGLTARVHWQDHLREEFECFPGECRADFDGDGTQAEFQLNRERRELTIREGGRVILVMPCDGRDNTWYTHLGIRHDADAKRPLLIVYDTQVEFLSPAKKRTAAVYAYRGGSLVQQRADLLDREILRAMAAVDDHGTMNVWLVYLALRWPFRVIYLFHLGLAILARFKRLRRVVIYVVSLAVLYGASWLVSFTIVVGWSEERVDQLIWQYEGLGKMASSVHVFSAILFLLGIVPVLLGVRRLLSTSDL